MKRRILLLLATLHVSTAQNEDNSLNHEPFVHRMKERVIQFPEESHKLRFVAKANETNTEDEPRLKDIYNSRHRRSSRNGQRVRLSIIPVLD